MDTKELARNSCYLRELKEELKIINKKLYNNNKEQSKLIKLKEEIEIEIAKIDTKQEILHRNIKR